MAKIETLLTHFLKIPKQYVVCQFSALLCIIIVPYDCSNYAILDKTLFKMTTRMFERIFVLLFFAFLCFLVICKKPT